MAHNPNLLRYKPGEELIEKICDDARRCLPIESCFVKNGVKLNTYRQWRRWYREEVEEGLEDTPIINLFSRVYQAERESEAVILDIEVDHALITGLFYGGAEGFGDGGEAVGGDLVVLAVNCLPIKGHR